MQRPFVSSPYFSTVMFTPLYLERDQPDGNFEAADQAPNQKRQNGDFGVQKIMNFAHVRYWISHESAIPN